MRVVQTYARREITEIFPVAHPPKFFVFKEREREEENKINGGGETGEGRGAKDQERRNPRKRKATRFHYSPRTYNMAISIG